MIIAKIILWTLIVVQIGLLIGLIAMAVRTFLNSRRHQKKLDEIAKSRVIQWSSSIEQKVTEAAKSALYGPKPPSFATHYLLQEGFLVVYRKPDQRIVLTASKDNEMLLTNFRVDRDHGMSIIINTITNETTPVTDEFISRWSVNGS